MTILYIIDKLHHFAGMERILSCKMNYLADQTGWRIDVLTYEQGDAAIPFRLSPSIKHHDIDCPFPSRENRSFLQWCKSYAAQRRSFVQKLSKALAQIKPDIVVATTYSFAFLDIIVQAAKRQGIQVVVESHTKGDTVTFAYKYWYNKRLLPFIAMWDKHIMKALKKADCLIALTREDASYWGTHCPCTAVIPNMLTVRPLLCKDYGSQRVIAAGRYMPEKGFDRLLQSWKIVCEQHPDWTLCIYGNGDTTPYQELCNTLGISSNVALCPAVDNIAEKYADCSIYALSSRYEGFGLVLTEAMSCGLPCVSFDCPNGPRNIITSGEDGILVTDGDIEAFATALCSLISNEELRKQMGQKALRSAQAYSIDSIMKDWTDLFKRITN